MNIGDKVIIRASADMLDLVSKLKEKGYFVNTVTLGEELVGIVVKVWGPTCANLKVKLDGDGPDLWITSATLWDGNPGAMSPRHFRLAV